MRVLLSVASLASAYGGPARSVSKLADALAALGIDMGLWAPDGTAVTTQFLPKNTPVRRLRGGASEVLDTFGPLDLIHDSGIWLPHNHRLARLATRRGILRVVSIRGMLEPWALNHKRWKKRLAWHLYQQADLKAAACHHVTSVGEKASVEAFNWPVPIRLIPNGVDIPDLDGSLPRRTDAARKTALFLGRIHPVKGLPMLVEAWVRVQPVGWTMQIAGPDEVNHRAEVEALIRSAGLSEAFEFTGALDGTVKEQAFLNADLFVLPSHTENFGMAIGEALAHGLPVITTKGAPWEQLEQHRCGWRTAINADGLAAALQEATSLTDEARAAMGQRGRAWMQAAFGWQAVAEDMAQCYQDLLDQAKLTRKHL